MSFADIEVKFNKPNENSFRKTEWMSLTQGAHTVRILNEQAKTVPTHFFNNTKTSVACLGADCPVCQNNKNLIAQFPNNFRDQVEYNKVTYRFFVNVLDKTLAKVCECGKEYKALVTTICTCGKVLPDAAPLNKVKLLSKGITLRDDLASIEKAIQTPTGDPIPLTQYDMVLMVSGSGKDTKVTPVPRTESNEPVDIKPEDLFPIENAIIRVTPEEILDIQRGVRLKDIFAARRTKQSDFNPETFERIAPQADIDAVNAKVANLFNQE